MAVAFARVLRGAGVDVPVGRAVTFAEALTLTGVDRSGPVYWSGRTTLLGRPEDIPTYDRAFEAFWRQRLGMTLATTSPMELTIVLDTEDEPPAGQGGDEPVESEGPTLVVRWSRQEVLRHKDFAAYTHAEFEEARRLMNDLRLHGALQQLVHLPGPIGYAERGRQLLRVASGWRTRRPFEVSRPRVVFVNQPAVLEERVIQEIVVVIQRGERRAVEPLRKWIDEAVDVPGVLGLDLRIEDDDGAVVWRGDEGVPAQGLECGDHRVQIRVPYRHVHVEGTHASGRVRPAEPRPRRTPRARPCRRDIPSRRAA